MPARRFVRFYCQGRCLKCERLTTWKTALEPSNAEVGDWAPIQRMCDCGGLVVALGTVIGAWHGSAHYPPSPRSAQSPKP